MMILYPSLGGDSAPDWKVPTPFIYGADDRMDWGGAQEAQKKIPVGTDLLRVPQVKARS